MPIRTKLVLAFLVLSLLPLAGIGVLAYLNGEKALRENLGESFTRQAEEKIDKVDRTLYEAQHNVQTWASIDLMQEVATDDLDGKISAFLIGLGRKYQDFSSILAVNAKGEVVASSHPDYIGASFASASAFRPALEGRLVVEDVHLDEVEKIWVVTIAVPIASQYEGSLGVLCAKWKASELTAMTKSARSFVQASPAAGTSSGRASAMSTTTLIRKDGLVLAAPPSEAASIFTANLVASGSQAAVLARERGSGFLVEPRKGGKALVGYSHSRGYRDFASLGWSALVSQDARSAFASIRQLELIILGVGSAVAVLVIAMAVVVTRQITSPVLAVADVATRVARGDFTGRIDYQARDEIGALAKGVNQMIVDPASQREELVEKDFVDSIITNMLDTLIVLDEKGVVRTANRSALELLAYRPDQLVGRTAAAIFGEQPEAFLKKRLPELLRGDVDDFDQAYVTRDGRRIPVSLSASVLKDDAGRLTGIILNAKDITEIKQAQEAMRKAKDEAEQANQSKSQFLANMSHELRTPLNAVIGYSEMMHDDMVDAGTDEYLPDLKKVQAAGKHLLSLINDILDLSKIEAGKMELFLEEFDLLPLIEEVSVTVAPLIGKNANTLVISGGENAGRIKADITRVRQVLFNLLSNASKFCDKGTITLDVKRERHRRGERLVLRVIDTGIGMTPEQLSRMFQAFSQADASTTRKFGGTGLGLIISRKFCQMMGGDIKAESEYGHGTTFVVTLPVEVVEAQGKSVQERNQLVTGIVKALEARGSGTVPVLSPGPGPAVELTADMVLVIDDDAAIREMVARLVTKEGYKVMGAASGREGLEMARTFRPSVITLDVMMPEMDGWSVLAELKGDPALRDIPVVMLSVLDEHKLGFALGASDYLTKPVDRERLLPLLKRHLSGGGSGGVLVVDDDDGAREMLRRLVEREGHEVVEARNGRIALERLAERIPQLVLLDLFMPEMDGFEFVSRVRKEPAYRAIPVVVITSKDLGAEDRDRLSGSVETILERGALSREELERELTSLIHVGIRGGPPGADSRQHEPTGG